MTSKSFDAIRSSLSSSSDAPEGEKSPLPQSKICKDNILKTIWKDNFLGPYSNAIGPLCFKKPPIMLELANLTLHNLDFVDFIIDNLLSILDIPLRGVRGSLYNNLNIS